MSSHNASFCGTIGPQNRIHLHYGGWGIPTLEGCLGMAWVMGYIKQLKQIDGRLQRSSSPEAPPQDLWSTILNSVSSSRLTPAKNILVLGQPSTGKSTLVCSAADTSKDEPHTDYAVRYDWADVRDKGEEGMSLSFAFRITQSYMQQPTHRYPCPVIHIHRPFIFPFMYSPLVAFLVPSICSSPHCSHNCARLDTTLDLP